MSTRNPVLTRTVASTPANRATRCPRSCFDFTLLYAPASPSLSRRDFVAT